MKKFSYSFFAFSLSCLGIPLYIHLAAFYFNNFQISLGLIGLTIFICRIFDCVFDPLAGFVSDRLIAKRVGRATIILIASLPLLINFYFLFNPFYSAEKQLIYWLGGNLLLLYFFLSFVVVNYEAMVSDFKDEQSKFIAAREFMQILGILTISVLPSIISKKLQISYDESLSYLWIFILPFFVSGVFLLQKNFQGLENKASSSFKFSFKLREFKNLFFVYFLNSVAVSIPAVAIRFYVDEHLKVPNLNGYFLGLYFFTAAISVFIWAKIINKIGAKKSWQSSILLSVAIFIFAAFITEKNYYLFYVVCLLSGFAVGCDLTAPQLILLAKINNEKNKTSYFAIFSLITKISLAIASLLVLNLITKNGVIDYGAIPYVYSLLPCLIKVLTVIFLKKL
jgi:GPH family glycoside/pentoside/hexuronide:cation symporter